MDTHHYVRWGVLPLDFNLRIHFYTSTFYISLSTKAIRIMYLMGDLDWHMDQCISCYSINTRPTSNQCLNWYLVDMVTNIYMGRYSWWYTDKSLILHWHFAEYYSWYINNMLDNKSTDWLADIMDCNIDGISDIPYRLPWSIYRSICWSLLDQIMTDKSITSHSRVDRVILYVTVITVNVSVEVHWLMVDSLYQWACGRFSLHYQLIQDWQLTNIPPVVVVVDQ